MKIIAIQFLLIFIPLFAFSQDSLSIIPWPTKEIRNIQDTCIKYIVEDRISHRYPTGQFEKNIRLLEKNGQIFMECLDDSNNVLSISECTVIIGIDIQGGYPIGDSISQFNYKDLEYHRGQDSTIPSVIYVYMLIPKRHGKHTEFYKNGKVKVTGKYYFGSLDGVWRFYNENGKLIKKEKWKNNKLINSRENRILFWIFF